MRNRSVAVLLILAFLLPGCSRHDRVVAAAPFDPTTLAGGTFNVVAKNTSESIILLGRLDFTSGTGTDIRGTWNLRQWSGQDVPGLPGTGTMTGQVFGSAAILELDLGAGNTLGLVIDHTAGERAAGTITLLPSGSFRGTIEAIRAASP